MKIVFDETKKMKPIKTWCMAPEEGALEQAMNLAQLPFLHKHVALMPDTHFGFGMPIGGVIALDQVVIPGAVGVDIGCGMCAAKFGVKAAEFTPDMLRAIMGKIHKAIPVGFNHHQVPTASASMPEPYLGGRFDKDPDMPIVMAEYKKATLSLGTLGGGNHFIELQKDEEGNLWAMIHSGSRNLGKTVCDYYTKIAADLNKTWRSSVPAEWKLAFLPSQSTEGKQYLKEMEYCLRFAKASRMEMMLQVSKAICDVMPAAWSAAMDITDVHHNYAQLENHFGANVWVHRKGATSARAGETGIIPGSQGTASYIVRGKGCEDSFMSCSHGAGRAMSRTAAIKNLDLAGEIKRLDDQGIIHGIRNQKDLDEAAGSYKNIETVMKEQDDLVHIMHKLLPIAVVKG